MITETSSKAQATVNRIGSITNQIYLVVTGDETIKRDLLSLESSKVAETLDRLKVYSAIEHLLNVPVN